MCYLYLNHFPFLHIADRSICKRSLTMPLPSPDKGQDARMWSHTLPSSNISLVSFSASSQAVCSTVILHTSSPLALNALLSSTSLHPLLHRETLPLPPTLSPGVSTSRKSVPATMDSVSSSWQPGPIFSLGPFSINMVCILCLSNSTVFLGTADHIWPTHHCIHRERHERGVVNTG